MPRFFVDKVIGNTHTLTGEDASHIIKSLRMKVSDEITLCSNQSIDYSCTIENISNGEVFLKVFKSYPCPNEPKNEVTLYQGMPKSDKMDLIVQKSVELGVSSIVPVLTSRCISRPDNKSIAKKIDRFQKIAKEAAKQSQRGKIPKVLDIVTLNELKEQIRLFDIFIVFYENGGVCLKNLINPSSAKIGILIGPEGGFSTEEIDFLKAYGAIVSTLGSRILRTETAPLMALSVIMSLTDNI